MLTCVHLDDSSARRRLGSSDYGWQDINNRRTVVAVVYDKTLQGSPKASSYVDGCSQHSGADPQAVPVPEGASTSFRVGLRGDPVAYDRFFDGDLHELLVYNRTLSPDDLLAAQQYLASKWGTPVPTGVGGDCPNKPIHPLDCTALKSDATVAPSAEEIAAVAKFQSAAVAAGLAKSVPAGMAGAALAFMAGFDSRCQQLNNGTLQQLRRPSSTLASSSSPPSTSILGNARPRLLLVREHATSFMLTCAYSDDA